MADIRLFWGAGMGKGHCTPLREWTTQEESSAGGGFGEAMEMETFKNHTKLFICPDFKTCWHMVIFVSDFFFFLMMEIKVEAPSFPFPVRMLLPPSGGSSHDVLCLVHVFMLPLYICVFVWNWCVVVVLFYCLIYITGFICQCFSFLPLAFFHSYFWAVSILTAAYIY